jgi:response regulator RpfG family c-di-GMP phosphodiesterase
MNNRILCIDDEANVLSGLRRSLRGSFDLQLAEGPMAALEQLEYNGPFAVVMADMRMPIMDGAELLAKVQKQYPDSVRMMLTGNSNLETATRAVNEGNIFRFLNKPCSSEDLAQALQAGLDQHRLICAEREVLEQTLKSCVGVLTEILAFADPDSFQHTDGQKALASKVARRLDLPNPWEVEMAVMLAQIGRVTIPTKVLRRAKIGATLTKNERAIIRDIPTTGGKLIGAIPRLENVARMVANQEEDWQPRDQGTHSAGSQIIRALLAIATLEDSGLPRDQILIQLSQESASYAPEVLAAIADCSRAEAAESAGQTREIVFEELCPGHILGAPLYSLDGRMILKEGHVIGHVIMQRLSNHQRISGFKHPITIENDFDSNENGARQAS